jgi:hypothetical protein
MKTALEILSEVQRVLLSPEFMEKHKIRTEDFSRKPILTFAILIIFILNGIKKSTQVQLDAFVKVAMTGDITKSAFSDARKKIDSRAFIELNNVLIFEYYTNNRFRTYHGFIVFAIDGTSLQLPNSKEITDKYGFATNDKKDDKGMPISRASHVYDVLNGITISAYIEPYNTPERNIYFKHIKDIRDFKQKNNIEKILIILDRGYPSLGVILAAISLGIDVLARCRSDFLKKTIAGMVRNNQKDIVFKCSDLWPKLNAKQKRELKRNGLDFKLLENKSLRILVIELSTGEKEFLITTLVDQEVYKYDYFAELYFSRWGIEENYKFIKIRVEMENWSGLTLHSIDQDFYATIFSTNAHQLLLNQAQVEIEEEKTIICNRRIIKTIDKVQKKQTKKYEYKINRNVSMGTFKDKIIYALLGPGEDLGKICEQVISQSKKSLIPIRPGRKIPRIIKVSNRKFHMNQRRC